MHCSIYFSHINFVVAWLVFHTSQSHDINKSLASNETVRKSSMDSMYVVDYSINRLLNSSSEKVNITHKQNNTFS